MAKPKATTDQKPEPSVGDQVLYLAIEEIGGAVVPWAAEVTAVHEGLLLDLVVRSPGGYTGVALSVPFGETFGRWHWAEGGA